MTPKTATPTALILATFALVGLMTTGAVVPAAYAQVPGVDFLDLFDNNGNGETEEETTNTTQTLDQNESNIQSNSIDQDQTGAINEEIASGEGSSVSSDAESDAESTTKTKSKDGSTTIPGTSTSDSGATSDVSNTGVIEQGQQLNDAVQVNDNDFGNDETRAAVVGFDLEFEQSIEEQQDEPEPVPPNGDDVNGDELLFTVCVFNGQPETRTVTLEELSELLEGDERVELGACPGPL